MSRINRDSLSICSSLFGINPILHDSWQGMSVTRRVLPHELLLRLLWLFSKIWSKLKNWVITKNHFWLGCSQGLPFWAIVGFKDVYIILSRKHQSMLLLSFKKHILLDAYCRRRSSRFVREKVGLLREMSRASVALGTFLYILFSLSHKLLFAVGAS